MSKQHSRTKRTCWILALAMLVAGLTTSGAAAQSFVHRWEAQAQGQGHSGLAAGKATRINITLERWSTDAERKSLLEVMATNDGKKMEKAFEAMDVIGELNIPGQPGQNFSYAWKTEYDDGLEVIHLATPRPLTSYVQSKQDGRVEWMVAVVELVFDGDGPGKGQIAPALDLRLKESGRISIAHVGADPITLYNVRESK